MAKTPEEMETAMIANMPAKTGKSLGQWLAITGQRPELAMHGEIVRYLKAEHGVTHGYASLVAHNALRGPGSSAASGDDQVGIQYGGAKEALRPIYEALVERISTFGPDVELAPKKAYVSLRRAKQFGLVQPSTRTRVDVGIKLPGTEPEGRLELSGSFNAMVSHRVRVTKPEQIDDELSGWLSAAYDQAR